MKVSQKSSLGVVVADERRRIRRTCVSVTVTSPESIMLVLSASSVFRQAERHDLVLGAP